MGETVNETTARAATERNSVTLAELHLLGIITRPDTARALLRRPSGETFWAGDGHRTAHGTVVAVGETRVTLRMRTRRLVLPG